MSRPLPQRLLAEAVGTAILVGVGTGAMVATAGQATLRAWALPLAWFLAVTGPVALFASISGAHLNPVVTLAAVARRRLSILHGIGYALAQFGGALLGSALVLVTLGRADRLGSTVPIGGLVRAFVAELGFTLLLVLVVLFLMEHGAGRGRWKLLLPGAVVALSTYVIGPWSRSSLNPARTLAPAILSGTYTNLWLYFVAPTLGGILAILAWSIGCPQRSDQRRALHPDGAPTG
ncbi:MAG: aquaporin [Thermoplasmata archaeon]|nr:aquaporin [Thermoplasmata archaeon]